MRLWEKTAADRVGPFKAIILRRYGYDGRIAEHSRYNRPAKFVALMADTRNEKMRSMQPYSLCSSSCCYSVAAVLRVPRYGRTDFWLAFR